MEDKHVLKVRFLDANTMEIYGDDQALASFAKCVLEVLEDHSKMFEVGFAGPAVRITHKDNPYRKQ